MDRSLLVVGVALLAVTAGCSGFGGQSATTATETTAADPATTQPTTTAEPTQTQPAIAAPGFNEGRLVDPLALADAHKQSLSGSSFVREDERTTGGAGNATSLVRTYRVENATRWTVEQHFDGVGFLGRDAGTVDMFADGDYVYFRLDADGNVSYGRLLNAWGEEPVSDPPPMMSERYARDYVYAVFTTASWTTIVAEDTADGETIYRVVGNASGDTTFRGEPVSNFEVEAGVTGEGVVQYMLVNYDRNGTSVTRALSFSDVGETTAERPEWYDTAVNRTDAESKPN